MKRKLFLLLCALLTNAGMWAQLTNGTVYWIQDASTGQFISQGDNWSTKAVAQDVGGLGFEAVYISEGVYTLKNIMWNTVRSANLGLGDGQYVDQTPVNYELTASGVGYLVSYNGNYLVNNSAENDYKEKPIATTTDAAAATVWKFLTKSEYDAAIQAYKDSKAATYATNMGYSASTVAALETILSTDYIGKDYTSSIKNASLGSNWDNWTHGAISQRGEGAGVGSGCAEFWNGCGYAKQTVTNLPNGLYKVAFVGTYRPSNNTNSEKLASEKTSSPAFVYANDAKLEFLHWIDVPAKANNRSGITTANGYGQSFYTYVSDGTLNLGVVADGWNGDNGTNWNPFGQFTLTYYSNAVSEEDATEILNRANALVDAVMQGSIKTALTNAKNTFDGARTIVNYNALNTAIDNANASKDAYANAKAYLDEAAVILAGTNVYTAQAYADNYTTPLAKYEARTLTTEEGNALVKTSTGWHSANTIDDILLSAWTIGGEQCKDYDKSLYINTWSTEGATDGSEFLAPFFEYWTNDDKSLGANTLQATVTGLKVSTTYSFTIRARVRQTNGQSKIADGITMKVGEGEAVDISAGAKFNDTQFFIGNFSAVGETDADGKLTMTMTVAENSNISWLSFYNAKWTEGEDLSAYIADYEFAKSTAIANRDNAAYAAVTGKERVDLVNTITDYSDVDETNKAALIEAKEALETASGAFVSAAPAYNALAELNTTVASTLGVALPTITSSTTAADLDVEGIIVAEHTAAKAYAEDYTDKLGDWTNAPGTNSGESWDGTTGDGAGSYYDEYNKSARAMTQTVTLPAGDYALIAKGRASTNGRLTVVVGSETVTFPHKGATGRGIATDGTATFADNAIYANANAGRGWEYRVITFTSDGSAATTLTFNWTTASNNWCGLDDIELLCNPTALDYSALQTAYDAVVVPTLGFETGEYAPYNNKENLENISIAKNLLDSQNADNQEIIDNATTAITGMTWNANTEEVNAFRWNKAEDYSSDGETKVPTGGFIGSDANSRISHNPASNTGLTGLNQWMALMVTANTNATYGETEGYTLPLKASTVYEFKFKYAGWGECGTPTVTILKGAETIKSVALEAPAKTGNNSTDAWEAASVVFTTTEAGDYKVRFSTADGRDAFGDLELKKAPASVSATIGATGWTTFASPYALDLGGMSASEGTVKAYYASSVGAGKIVMTSTESEGVAAGTGLMLKGTAGATVTIPVAISGTGIDGNMLVGCTTETPVDASETCYVLINNGGTAEFQSLKNSGATIPAGKAYLNTGILSPARLIISFEEDPTAINAVEAVEGENGALKDGKYLIGNKVVLVKNGVKYSANGQKLN